MALVQIIKNLFDREANISDNLLRNNRFQLILLILGYMLIAAGIVLGLKVIFPVFIKFLNIVSPFILAFILAYIMNPGLRFMQEKFEFSRSGALMIVTVFVAGTLGLLLFLLTLIISQQVITLVDEISPAIQINEYGEVVYDTEAEQRMYESAADTDQLGDDEDMAGLYLVEDSLPDETASSTQPLEAELEDLIPSTNEQLASNNVNTSAEDRAEAAGDITAAPPAQNNTETGLESTTATGTAATSATTAQSPPAKSDSSRVAGVEDVSWISRLYQGAAKRVGDILNLGGDDAAPLGLSLQDAAAGGTQMAVYLGKQIFTIFNKVLAALIFLGFTIAVTFFMLLFYDQICRGFWLLVPFQYRDRSADLLAQIDHAIGGYLRGQLSVCFVVGFLWAFWLFIMGMPQYAILIGSITGAMNLIPYLGPFVGLASGFIYVLAAPYVGPGGIAGGIIFLLVGYSLLQVIESMVLQPKLVGDAAQLNPLVVIFALLVGAQFGMGGMLLAVPVAAVVRVLLIEFFWKSYMAQQRAKADEIGEHDIAAGAFERYDEMIDHLELLKRQKLALTERAPGFLEESRLQIAAIIGRFTGRSSDEEAGTWEDQVVEKARPNRSSVVLNEKVETPEPPPRAEPKERLSQPTNMPQARRRTSMPARDKSRLTSKPTKEQEAEAKPEQPEKNDKAEPKVKTGSDSETAKARSESKDAPEKKEAAGAAEVSKKDETSKDDGSKTGPAKKRASRKSTGSTKSGSKSGGTRKRTTRRKKSDSSDKS